MIKHTYYIRQKQKCLLFLILVIAGTSFITSCEYAFIKPEPSPDPVDTISFAQDVIPIFENNNCTGCHKPEGVPQLDFTAPNAYNTLVSNQLVNPADPTSSIIYTYPNPISGTHDNKYATEADAQTVLIWIKQGAKNN